MAQIDTLPPLREVIAIHELSARKALGQNFLLDLNLTSRIARSAGSLAGKHVIEIGPGPGGLTRAILAAGADHLTVVEMDNRCLPALAQIGAYYPGRLTIISGDALQTDMAALAMSRPTKIIANLPYNIASPLIVHWLQTNPWPPWFETITVMVQREYAERLVATTAERKDYGRLAILTGWRAEAEILFNVPPTAFVPQPKVMSSVVLLVPRQVPLTCDLKALEHVTQTAFGQRRKMLRQSLKPLGDASGLLAAARLPEQARAEEISIDGFVDLANAFVARK